ncbi:MAG: Heme oxygenase-like protein [Flavisolibacter sp.]|nr:Heme oxygenase-like protein [Flavisolibacter sp.]
MFLQNLRSRTASCHHALEQNPFSIALLSDTVSTDDYTAYLKKLYGFVYGFEKNVFPELRSFLPDIKRRIKAHLITSDLLSQNLDTQDIAVLPDAFFKSRYPTKTAAWGGMYVLEGSTLGGQIIKRHLQKKLDSGFTGSLYFTAYGAETGAFWKTFLQHLGEAAQDPEDAEQIIDSAVKTFSAIDTWITSGSYETK